MGWREKREIRACTGCNWKRKVKVSWYTIDGDEKIAEGYGEPSWRELCSVCELLSRARSHEHTARMMRQKAWKLKAARDARVSK